jgi:omega-6 fatty acid desaturase (delta-12 desaturase)
MDYAPATLFRVQPEGRVAVPGDPSATPLDTKGTDEDIRRRLLAISSQHSRADTARSVGQVCLTFFLWLASYVTGLSLVGDSLLGASGALVASAAFVIRLFIIQHDCGHRSFLRQRSANDMLGFWLGVLTMTPYRCWLRFHALHHTSSGNLDYRGMGDIHTLTTREYAELTPKQQRGYRIYRHPLVLLILGPPLLFILRQRTTHKVPKSWAIERRSIHLTNLAWAAMMVLPCVVYGPIVAFGFHLAMMSLAGIGGVWLFYVQHQYPEAYWRPESEWVSWHASMKGASYLDLPDWLRWLTANIGLHHIHHLDPRIPNYRLYECFTQHAEFASPSRITLRKSLACTRLRLWDPDAGRMVPFPTSSPPKNKIKVAS